MKPKQNPFAVETQWGTAIVGFLVPWKAEPLWWTGGGFKDLSRVFRDPYSFENKERADKAIREELIEFIRKWRSDQVELIRGW